MQRIRDLGVGTAALTFNISGVIFGVLLTAAACLLRREGPVTGFSALMALTGIRQVGIGTFSENTRTPHLIAASLMFVSGGILTIAASRVFPVPWAWISGTLGIITLVAIILFEI